MHNDTGFVLDPRLAQDTFLLCEWPLCSVLLMNDSQYPWVILVPRQAGMTEVYQLSEDDRIQLDQESCRLGRFLMQTFDGDSLNVAALGNVVSQLHIHHVVRYQTDAVWPAPVWGKLPAKPYDDKSRHAILGQLEPLRSFIW